MALGNEVPKAFEETRGIVAVDYHIEADSRKAVLHLLQRRRCSAWRRASSSRWSQWGLAGQNVTPACTSEYRFEIPVPETLPAGKQSIPDGLVKLRAHSRAGILVSTLLTLVVIPVLCYSAFRKEHQS